MENLIFGKTWDEIQAMQQGAYRPKTIDINKTGDNGADPIGNGLFKMVPSGDIVDFAERCKRLKN